MFGGFNIFTDFLGMKSDPFAGSAISKMFGGQGPEDVAKAAAEATAQQYEQQSEQQQPSSWIPGVPNVAVIAGAGGLVALLVLRK